ncbi:MULTISPECIES: hypothetical protein [unclassified Levilactobacillus]|uniref:hypothetical protein n=1 Tax=unclassified Levilactobacillus TaxID=2767918 RepID=UPI002FF1D14B
MSQDFPTITQDLFELETMAVDAAKHWRLLYAGYSNWAIGLDQTRRRGAFKFLKQVQTGNFYTLYLSPEYVQNHVSQLGQLNGGNRMTRPDLTANEWHTIDETISRFGVETNDVATILDSASNELLDEGVTDHLILNKPGEVFEAIYYTLWCKKYGAENFERSEVESWN